MAWHFLSFHMGSHSWARRERRPAHEELPLWGTRLCLRAADADAAHTDGSDASEPGEASWVLPSRREHLGTGQQLSFQRASQSAHRALDASLRLSSWPRTGED